MKLATGIGLLLAGIVAWRVCLLVDASTRMVEATARTVASLPGQVDAMRLDLNAQIAATRSVAGSQIDRLRDPLLALADARTAEALRIVDARTGQALDSVNGLRTDLAPAMAHVTAITASADRAAEIAPELTRNALGAVAAFKITSGELTKTAIDFRRATPGILDMVKKVGDNSDAATVEAIGTAKESRRLVKNLADNTTPLPKYIRYPAQVIGLIGSAAVPVVTLEKLATVKGQ